jgi:hypothetical protein
MLAGMMQGASDMSKEIAFLAASGAAEADYTNFRDTVNQTLSSIGSNAKKDSILSRVLQGASTIISGTNMVFPEIWGGSNYGRSYNIEINLRTPYGTREAIFEDIIVPMCHWIALAAPRQNTINTYSSPFICRFFIPGFCAVDMAMVESLTITKGNDGAWSSEGLPTEVNLSIQMKDLYSTMFTSKINGVSPTDAYNMLWNTSLIDYVAAASGLNMTQSEWGVKAAMVKILVGNAVTEQVSGRAFMDRVRQAIGTNTSRFSGLAGAK